VVNIIGMDVNNSLPTTELQKGSTITPDYKLKYC